jgi:hypothetical protein
VKQVISAAIVTAANAGACSTYTGLEFEGVPFGTGGSGEASAGANGGSVASVAGTSSGGEDDGGANAGTAPSVGSSSSGGTDGSGGILLTTEAGAPSAGADSGTTAPTAVELADATTSVVRTGTEPKVRFADRCPEGQMLIGFFGTLEAAGGAAYLRSIQGVCGTPALSADAPWTVTLEQAATLPLREVEFPQSQMALCPANQVVTAFAGRSGLWIDGLEVQCAPLKIAAASGALTLTVGTATYAGYLGGKTGGSAFELQACPSGTVAVGQTGGTALSGDVLGELGVMCAAVTLL